MTQEGKPIFGSSMFGYTKEEVDAYITQVTAELERLRAEVGTAKESADRELDELRAQLYDNSTVAENRTADYNALAEKYNGLCAEAEELRASLTQKDEELAKKDEEIAALRIRVDQNQQVIGNTLTEAEEKARQYDAVSSKIGSLIIKATRDAEEIRGTAEAEAETTRSEAAGAAQIMRADAEQAANETRAEAAREAEAYLKETRAGISTAAEAAYRSIEDYAQRTAKTWNSLFYESQLQMATLCNEIKQKLGDAGRTGSDEFTAFRDGLIQSVSLRPIPEPETAAETAVETVEAAEAAVEEAVEEATEIPKTTAAELKETLNAAAAAAEAAMNEGL